MQGMFVVVEHLHWGALCCQQVQIQSSMQFQGWWSLCFTTVSAACLWQPVGFSLVFDASYVKAINQ